MMKIVLCTCGHSKNVHAMDMRTHRCSGNCNMRGCECVKFERAASAY